MKDWPAIRVIALLINLVAMIVNILIAIAQEDFRWGAAAMTMAVFNLGAVVYVWRTR